MQRGDIGAEAGGQDARAEAGTQEKSECEGQFIPST